MPSYLVSILKFGTRIKFFVVSMGMILESKVKENEVSWPLPIPIVWNTSSQQIHIIDTKYSLWKLSWTGIEDSAKEINFCNL